MGVLKNLIVKSVFPPKYYDIIVVANKFTEKKKT